MKRYIISILASFLLATVAFAVPPECKENPKLCDLKAQVTKIKAEIASEKTLDKVNIEKNHSLIKTSATCEENCYSQRSACIKRQGNSHGCDEQYDSCVAGCN